MLAILNFRRMSATNLKIEKDVCVSHRIEYSIDMDKFKIEIMCVEIEEKDMCGHLKFEDVFCQS